VTVVVAAIYFFFQPYLSIDERVMAAVVTCFFSRPYLSIVERVMAAMTYFFLPEVGILATCSYLFCESLERGWELSIRREPQLHASCASRALLLPSSLAVREKLSLRVQALNMSTW